MSLSAWVTLTINLLDTFVWLPILLIYACEVFKYLANFLRIGDWRALYILDDQEKQIIIVDINVRGEVYNP